MKTRILFFAFVATVYAANWTLERFGVVELPLIGWMVPAGVLWAGLSFGLRDALHELGGRRWVLAGIAAGTTLSWWLSDAVTIPGGLTSIALASGVAFGLSELADLTVYEPLRERRWVAAVVTSNLAGAVVDSLLFLWLAFGTVDTVGGQVFGKAMMVLPALPVVAWARSRRGRERQYGAVTMNEIAFAISQRDAVAAHTLARRRHLDNESAGR